MPNLEWERSVYFIGDARVEHIREKVEEDFFDDYDDFFNRFN